MRINFGTIDHTHQEVKVKSMTKVFGIVFLDFQNLYTNISTIPAPMWLRLGTESGRLLLLRIPIKFLGRVHRIAVCVVGKHNIEHPSAPTAVQKWTERAMKDKQMLESAIIIIIELIVAVIVGIIMYLTST